MYICIYRTYTYICPIYRESKWITVSTHIRGGWARYVSSSRDCQDYGLQASLGGQKSASPWSCIWSPRFTLPESHYSAHTGLELIPPHSAHCWYHVCTFTPISEVSLFVYRTFTLGTVHYSGYDNYVTKIWYICCLTTCLGVGCFCIFRLRENFWKKYFAKKG